MLGIQLLSRREWGLSRRVLACSLLAAFLAAFSVAAPDTSAEQLVIPKLKRVYADTVRDPKDGKLIIDGVDDKRVDAGVAILDAGIDLDHPDLNVVAGVECVNTLVPGVCDATAPEAGNDIFEDDSGSPLSPPGFGHGTGTALGLAGIDNDIGMVGVAPGARIYAVRDSTNVWKKTEEGSTYEMDLDPVIGALRWVAANADEIDVALGGIHSLCLYDEPIEGTPHPYCADEEKIEEFEDAAKEVVDAGVVWVLQASNMQMNVENFVGPSNPNPIVASAMADWDGLPGSLASAQTCPKSPVAIHVPKPDKDDSLSEVTNWGNNVDIASPGCATSGAGPVVAGAAALLASIKHPETRADVEEIRADLLGDGDCAVNPPDLTANVGTGDCEWTHDPANHPGESPDTVKEPLLDLHDTEVFAPKVVPGTEPAAVEADVNGDGRADLVSLRHDGVVYVHPSNTEGKFGTGVDSFSGAHLNPAQYDGVGEYVIDVSDVNGDKRSDLVTLTDDGEVDVYLGESTSHFDEDPIASDLNLTPGLLDAGGVEPIAVADVDGGGLGDLVVYNDVTNEVVVYRGKFDGTFGHYGPFGHAGTSGWEGPFGVTALTGIQSALHTGNGHYFVDAADVTGDNRADLVSMHEGSLEVFEAHEHKGTFEAPVVSQEGAIDPVMDDGSGYEPVGLGDVTKDGHADLALIKSGTAYVYPGGSAGSFGSATTSFGGLGTSTTFQSGVYEMIGLLDANGNGNADLIAALSSNNTVRAVLGENGGTFGTGVVSSGTFPSTQHLKNQTSSGNQFVSEKPSWRRRGCDSKGCGWLIKSVPNASETPDDKMTDVSCTSAASCFATANVGSGGTGSAYALAWDGSSWKTKGEVPEKTGTELNAVSCTSASACTAVGHETEPNGDVLTLAVRWNGTSWTRQPVPNAAGAPNNRLTDVSCASSTFCLATGYLISGGTTWAYGRVWNGSEWSKATGSFSNGGVVLNGVSCTSSSSCMAVGHETKENGDVLNIAVGWGAAGWTGAQSVPNAAGAPNNRLTDVSCTSSTFCFATGYLTTNVPYGYGRVWNGSEWSKAMGGSFSNLGVVMSGVSCTSPISCTVVGHETVGSEVLTFAAYWSGTVWTDRQLTPNAPGAEENRLMGVSCVFPSCTAVGSYVDGTKVGNLAEHSQ